MKAQKQSWLAVYFNEDEELYTFGDKVATFTKEVTVKLDDEVLTTKLEFTRSWEGKKFERPVPVLKLVLPGETMREKILLDGRAENGEQYVLQVLSTCVLLS